MQAQGLQGRANDRGIKAYWAHWPRNFDYLVMLDVEEPTNPFPAFLDPVHEGSFFMLYSVNGNEAVPR